MRKAFQSLGLDTQGFVGRSSFLYPDYQYLFTRVFARVHDSSSAIPPMGIARMDGHGDTYPFFQWSKDVRTDARLRRDPSSSGMVG